MPVYTILTAQYTFYKSGTVITTTHHIVPDSPCSMFAAFSPPYQCLLSECDHLTRYADCIQAVPSGHDKLMVISHIEQGVHKRVSMPCIPMLWQERRHFSNAAL